MGCRPPSTKRRLRPSLHFSFFIWRPRAFFPPLSRGTRSPRHATMGAYLSAPVTTKVCAKNKRARRTGGASLFRGRRIVNGRRAGASARPSQRAALPPRANARAASKACSSLSGGEKGGSHEPVLPARADMNFRLLPNFLHPHRKSTTASRPSLRTAWPPCRGGARRWCEGGWWHAGEATRKKKENRRRAASRLATKKKRQTDLPSRSTAHTLSLLFIQTTHTGGRPRHRAGPGRRNRGRWQ